MPRPRTTTDEQILTAARACFLAHGPGVSTVFIAAQLRISHAVLFQRFGTKERLMRAALLPEVDPALIARLRQGPDERALETQVREIADRVFRFFQSMVPNVAVLRAAGVAPLPAREKPDSLPQVRTRHEVVAWFERAAARKLVRPDRAAHAAELLLAALVFRPFQQHLGRVAPSAADDDAFLRFVVDVVCAAVRPASRSSRPSRASGPSGTRTRKRS